MLDLGSLLPKRPENLSGGEQQKVAIARALLSNPQLLVMDEPLGSIDTVAKNRILPYLQRLHDTLKVPMIYVSHALDEVLTLADNVIFLKAGQSVRQQSVRLVLSEQVQYPFSIQCGMLYFISII